MARKRIVGQIAKKDAEQNWYRLDWEPGNIESWVTKFEKFLTRQSDYNYYQGVNPKQVEEANSLTEIGNAGKGFVSFIYADGNNMGGYIQKIKTPQEYQEFSQDIFEATEQSVYHALAKHLNPHRLKNLTGDNTKRNNHVIHPFEIITIGGDDVLLIVPAKIAKTIGEEFEKILCKKEAYRLPSNEQTNKSNQCHRYVGETPTPSICRLSMSIGLLTTSYNTPIYYAENLTNQLLKTAKEKAKALKQEYQYHGGTIDFLVLKSVTMISSNIKAFREGGLVKKSANKPTLKLYASPYTLHEIGGLLKTAEVLQQSGFPRSQLYQIRSLLEKGKNTAMLNYRYFVVRLQSAEARNSLKTHFEEAWCQPKDANNNGNLAPWMSIKQNDTTVYETIWRELIDIYPFQETKHDLSTTVINQHQ